jgi:elongation factor P hydroxylase
VKVREEEKFGFYFSPEGSKKKAQEYFMDFFYRYSRLIDMAKRTVGKRFNVEAASCLAHQL